MRPTEMTCPRRRRLNLSRIVSPCLRLSAFIGAPRCERNSASDRACSYCFASAEIFGEKRSLITCCPVPRCLSCSLSTFTCSPLDPHRRPPSLDLLLNPSPTSSSYRRAAPGPFSLRNPLLSASSTLLLHTRLFVQSSLTDRSLDSPRTRHGP